MRKKRLTLTMTSMTFWFSLLVSPKDLTLKEQILRARVLLMARIRSSREASGGDILVLLLGSGLSERTVMFAVWAPSHLLRPLPQSLLTYKACR